jgi:hypothetical protein
MMPIPFTQYHLPDGRRTEETISASPDIEMRAFAFIAKGGWFECEILSTGQVSFTACKRVKGESRDVAIEICDNGPAVIEAVNRLVTSVVGGL